jgi:hypothetical protein
MQNRPVSYFEECLTLGQCLGEDNSRALYKYLLQKNKKEYKKDADFLLNKKTLMKFVANGEIVYEINRNIVKYKSRAKGDTEFIEVLRELKLGSLKFFNIKKISKFFAQCEVDVIHNFPLPGANIQEEGSYTYNTYPFYELNYYSNGKGKVRGFINKLKTDDSELLQKLKA